MLTLKDLRESEKIKEIMKDLNAIFPDDKVLVVLKEMGLEDKALRFDEENVQRLFYYCSVENPNLFKEFAFTTTGTYPYSRLLERIIQRLKIPRILKTENPDYECMRLAEGTSDFVTKEIIPRLDPKEHEILKSLGNKLREESQKSNSFCRLHT